MSEPFEEFQFKPLTDGLGFHRKAESAGKAAGVPPKNKKEEFTTELTPSGALDLDPVEAPRPASRSISELIASLPPSLDFLDDKEVATPVSSMAKSSATKSMPPSFSTAIGKERESKPSIFHPLGQEQKAISPAVSNAVAAAATAASSVIGTAAGGATVATPTKTPYKASLDKSFARAFPQAETRKSKSAKTALDRTWVPSVGNVYASLLDAMVVMGVSTLFLVCILLITKADLVGLLTTSQTDFATQINLAILYTSSLLLYMLTSRSFFGSTLGEWAFDMRLGKLDQQEKTWYPLAVLWRATVMSATGFIVLPLLSWIAGRDLAYYLCGVKLYVHVRNG